MRLGGPVPRLGLARVEAQPVDHQPVRLGIVLGHLADGARGEAEVEARHDVREEVVVHDRRVLVGPGHAVDVERLLAVAVARAPEAERRPQARGLDRDVDALAVEELDVARRADVLREREAHVGVDVVLRGPGRVVRRGLFAVDRAPREERAVLVELVRAAAGRRKHEVPHPERVARPERRRVREERQHVDLGVPEVVAAVARPGDALRGNALAVGAGRGLRELEEAPAGGLLQVVVPADAHVRALPEPVEPDALPLVLALDALDLDAVERATAAVDELARRHAARGVVAHELRDADRHAGLGLHAEHVLGDVGLDERAGVVLVLGLDEVVGDDGDRHAGFGHPVRERGAPAVLPVLLRLQHALVDALGLARVEAGLLGGRRACRRRRPRRPAG